MYDGFIKFLDYRKINLALCNKMTNKARSRMKARQNCVVLKMHNGDWIRVGYRDPDMMCTRISRRGSK